LDGKTVDWESLFADYQSAVEWPTVAFLPEIVQYYKKSKVVLTQRDPESWYKGANATIYDGLELSANNPDPIKREKIKIGKNGMITAPNSKSIGDWW
jgi:hypothetical protein